MPYGESTYVTRIWDGNIKSLPLFADISICTLQHTVPHPKELLFATQFAQSALVVMSHAAIEDMRLKVCDPAGFRLRWPLTGRILCPLDILLSSSLINIVFYHVV